MKFLHIILVTVSIIILSCSPSKKSSVIPANGNKDSLSTRILIADGLSYETAVVILKTTESAGVTAEYQWIREHYSNYHVVRQSLTNYKKKPYDIIQIQFSDEKKLDLYFDISHYFGHF
jgi:hypothetical protein